MTAEKSNLNKIEKGRETLLALEKEGLYLFHGSPELVEEFEPRQAKKYDYNSKQMVNDGEPSVAATPFADIAIFRAIINNKIKTDKGQHWSLFGNDNGKLEFETTHEILELAKKAKGFVYVFKKKDFERYNNLEWRTGKPIKPIKIFEVDFKDLPGEIKLQNSRR